VLLLLLLPGSGHERAHCVSTALRAPAHRRSIIAAILTVPLALLAMASMVPAAEGVEMGERARVIHALPWSWLVQGLLSGLVQVGRGPLPLRLPLPGAGQPGAARAVLGSVPTLASGRTQAFKPCSHPTSHPSHLPSLSRPSAPAPPPPPQVYIGRIFYSAAWAGLRHRSANMSLLVALGTTAAFAYSILSVAFAARDLMYMGHVYFETSALILTFVCLGKFLESAAKSRTSDVVAALLSLAPQTALLLRTDPLTGAPGWGCASGAVRCGLA
jgi:hypothetical protein